jgi:CHAD domain-containing protein
MLYLKSTVERCEEEDIHQLRVSTKRIKALLELFLSIMPEHNFTEKYFSIYSSIFNKSGNVRNIQIIQNIISSMIVHIPSRFDEYLRIKAANSKKEMLFEIERFDRRKLYRQNSKLYKIIKLFDDSDTIEKSHFILASNFSKVLHLLDNDYEGIKLHKIRKKLRSSGEIMKVINEIEPNEKVSMLFKELKEIRDILGFWHDYEILSDYVKNFEKSNEENADQLKYIIDQINLEKDSLKMKAVDKLNTFYQNDLQDILKNN